VAKAKDLPRVVVSDNVFIYYIFFYGEQLLLEDRKRQVVMGWVVGFMGVGVWSFSLRTSAVAAWWRRGSPLIRLLREARHTK
jgi:hypothetical protein